MKNNRDDKIKKDPTNALDKPDAPNLLSGMTPGASPSTRDVYGSAATGDRSDAATGPQSGFPGPALSDSGLGDVAGSGSETKGKNPADQENETSGGSTV